MRLKEMIYAVTDLIRLAHAVERGRLLRSK